MSTELIQKIEDFLRDGQYRIGQLSVMIDQSRENSAYDFHELSYKRELIIMLMDVLYEGKWYIRDGFNHIKIVPDSGTKTGWTEKELSAEIEYVRYVTNMQEIPFLSFTLYYPMIINGSGGSGSTNLSVSGMPGMVLFFNASGNLYADYIDEYGGMYSWESINSYFSNRL